MEAAHECRKSRTIKQVTVITRALRADKWAVTIAAAYVRHASALPIELEAKTLSDVSAPPPTT